jgi:hypothetical protein
MLSPYCAFVQDILRLADARYNTNALTATALFAYRLKDQPTSFLMRKHVLLQARSDAQFGI